MNIMRYAKSVVKYSMTESPDNQNPVKAEETVLILVDDETESEVWQAFFIALKDANVVPVVMLINKLEHDYQNDARSGRNHVFNIYWNDSRHGWPGDEQA